MCDPPPPPPELLQPAIPAAKQANRIRPAAAYPTRLLADKRRCIAKNTISSKETRPSGSTGTCGCDSGFDNGTNSESAVVRVAVHNAVVVLVPAVGVHITALPKLLDPFLNCTVPVGPAPLLVVFTFAVSVTLPPDAMVVALEVTVVVVASPVTVMLIAPEVEVA